MKLVSMKIAPKDAKAEADLAGTTPSPANEPLYPWGLQLHLDDDELRKLGIEGESDVDALVTIEAKGIVTGYSTRRTQDGKEHRCLDIQLTDMSLAPAGDERSADEVLYPKKK